MPRESFEVLIVLFLTNTLILLSTGRAMPLRCVALVDGLTRCRATGRVLVEVVGAMVDDERVLVFLGAGERLQSSGAVSCAWLAVRFAFALGSTTAGLRLAVSWLCSAATTLGLRGTDFNPELVAVDLARLTFAGCSIVDLAADRDETVASSALALASTAIPARILFLLRVAAGEIVGSHGSDLPLARGGESEVSSAFVPLLASSSE